MSAEKLNKTKGGQLQYLAHVPDNIFYMENEMKSRCFRPLFFALRRLNWAGDNLG